MLRTIADQLIRHERIETTVPKAKELRRVADKMISLRKEGTLAARRRAKAILRTDKHHQIVRAIGRTVQGKRGRVYAGDANEDAGVGDAARRWRISSTWIELEVETEENNNG